MNIKANSISILRNLVYIIIATLFLGACNGKFPGADARKFPADPKKRVEQNLKEGKGITFNEVFNSGGGKFDFANSNPLWRASLDVISFMPLISANYSGGVIITDWYSDQNQTGESIKITIRFLTNEIRSDSLDIKIFTRKCIDNLISCKVLETNKVLVSEIQKQILRKAAVYEKEIIAKTRKR